MLRLKDLTDFIVERQKIYEKKQRGDPKPWTKDKILQKYKFTNVYREQDRVTEWVRINWREPLWETEHLWFAMAVTRLVNWPESLDELTPCVSKNALEVAWDKRQFTHILTKRRAAGKKVWGAAYIVSTNGVAMDKILYVANKVLNPLWKRRGEVLAAIQTKSLAHIHQALMQTIGMGSFLAAQVIADIRMVPPLDKAVDLDTWAASGPGSRRGLNRVYENPVDQHWKEEEWLALLQNLSSHIQPRIAKANLPPIHLQDLQNCLCEFDKYERVRLGQGHPKALYPREKE